MTGRSALAILVLLALEASPAWAQGLLEFGGLDSNSRAAATGLGAGLAGSSGNGGALRRSYQSAAEAQKAILEKTKVIEQYYQSGCAYEAKKQWKYADMSYKYVLQLITLRDGPGSPTSVPVLQHLVTTSKAEKNLNQAINCQKTLVTLAKAEKKPNDAAILQFQQELGGLYLEKQDYAGAELVLRDVVALINRHPEISQNAKQDSTLKTYSMVLRKLNKNAEADKIDARKQNVSQPSTSSLPTAARYCTAGNTMPR